MIRRTNPCLHHQLATIKARKQANGEMRYTAIVRVRSGQTVLHSESKTFGYRTAASTWAKRREVALEDPAELQRAQGAADSAEGYKLAALIGTREVAGHRGVSRPVRQGLRTRQASADGLVILMAASDVAPGSSSFR